MAVSGRAIRGSRGGLVASATTLLAIALGARVLGASVPWLSTLLLILGSLLVQAFPFVVVGSLASAAIGTFVPPGALERLARLPRWLQLPAAGIAGIALPICECGSVPVARRLIARGLAPAAGVTFMLAAPILNPIVLFSTWVAFRTSGDVALVVGGRAALGLAVAVAVGWVIGDAGGETLLRRASDDAEVSHLDLGAPPPRWTVFLDAFGGEVLFMGRYLVLGATLAALVQTFLPAQALGTIASQPVVAVFAMMLLAALLSLCSESDAFVAASFVQFGIAPQLAFLVFGPMVDLKLGALYAGTFRRDIVVRMVIAAAAATAVGALWIGVLAG